MYDILIKGGRVIDPAQNIDSQMDVAVNGEKIAAVSRNIPAKEGKKVIDAKGMVVTPGLIDVHAHVCEGAIQNGVAVDIAGVRQGVTTVVDAGSTGEAHFDAFPKHVIPKARTSVYCLLHISSLGLSLSPELRDMWEIDVKATTEKVKQYPGLIRGIKLRLVGGVVAKNGVEIARTAKKVAKEFNIPFMVHMGDTTNLVPPAVTHKVISLLERGDILSHFFTARQGSAMRPDGSFIPELKAAVDRGVLLDIAHGRFNCSFEVARKGIAQGILPYTISSDLTWRSADRGVFGLPVTMSKFLALGLSLNQVVAMSTINPAKAIGIDKNVGSLKPGMDADVSILELTSGKWKLQDAEQETLIATQLITPKLTVKAGKVALIKLVAQPERIE